MKLCRKSVTGSFFIGYLYCLFAVFTLVGHSAFAQDPTFLKVELAYGISLDIPSHWTVLSQDTQRNLRATSDAMVNNTGLEGLSGRKKSLLAVNATPDPSGATIRVSVTSQPDYTQADLAVATPAELKDASSELERIFKKLEVVGGPKIIEVKPAHIEKFNNYLALVMPYVRAGINETSSWQVTQYKIPVNNRLIEITFSHRQSEASLWLPTLERVRLSVRF